MTTKKLDTTVSSNLQDNSSVEYVDSHESPIATIQTEPKNLASANQLFDFNAEHNGEACIASLDPKDTRENKFWFTIAMFCTIYGVAEQTIRDNLKSLGDDGEIGLPEISGRRINIEDSCGVPHPTTIYNLTVLNRLGMCCFRKNRKAKEIRDKFNDVLVERETQTQQSQPQPQVALPTTYLEALEALVASEKAKLALQAERDEAIRTKALIGSKREATAMATASAKSRECKKLTIENEELKDAIGRGNNWHTVSMMKAEWKRDFGHEPSWHKLKEFSADLPEDMKPIKDVEEKIVLHNGSEKVRKVYRYHIEAWTKYREYEENLRVTAESRRDAKILDLKAIDTEVDVIFFGE